MIMAGQCRLFNRNLCSTLVGSVETGEAVQMAEQGVYGKSLYLPLHWAVNLRMLYKTKVLKIFLSKEIARR